MILVVQSSVRFYMSFRKDFFFFFLVKNNLWTFDRDYIKTTLLCILLKVFGFRGCICATYWILCDAVIN